MPQTLDQLLIRAETPAAPSVVRGLVANEPASLDDDLFVTVAAFDGGRQHWGPCDWAPNPILPKRGDDCLVFFDERETPWVLLSEPIVGIVTRSGHWTWEQTVNDVPAAGEVALNAATWAATTSIRVSKTTNAGADTSAWTGALAVDDQINLQETADATRFGRYKVTGAQVDHGSWVEIPVSFVNGGTMPSGGRPDMTFTAIMSTVGAGAAGPPGPPGPSGTPGEVWFTGSGAPVGALGIVGDWYLDSAGGDYYEKTAAAAWTLRGNLRGPVGPQGAVGPPGATGSQGPAGPQGPKGDTGAQGATGSQGPAGATGSQGPPGATGAQGPPGQGVPAGGTAGQALVKKTGSDYDTQWAAAAAAALPADTVLTASTRIIANKLLAADAQPIYRLYGDGKQEWGAGGATAPDVNLYRSSADNLRTDDTLRVGASLVVDNNDAGSSLYFGSALDTRLYRQGANALNTPGTLSVGGRIWTGGPSTGGVWLDGATGTQFVGSFDANNAGFVVGANWRFLVRNDGYINVNGQSDTWIYRSGAGNLTVDNTLRTVGALVVGSASDQRIYWGADLGVYLVRSGSSLRSNGGLQSDYWVWSLIGQANQVVLYGGRGVPEIIFGGPNDCSLYRESAHWINHYSADGAWGGFKAAVFSVQSDRKTKSEIEPAEVPVERLLNTGIYTYERDKWPGRHLGLIADELPDELTGVGSTPDGERMQFVDLYKLATALLATVQHLDGRLKALEGNV